MLTSAEAAMYLDFPNMACTPTTEQQMLAEWNLTADELSRESAPNAAAWKTWRQTCAVVGCRCIEAARR